MVVIIARLWRIRHSIACKNLDNSMINNLCVRKKKELGRIKLLCFTSPLTKHLIMPSFDSFVMAIEVGSTVDVSLFITLIQDLQGNCFLFFPIFEISD